LEKKTRKSKTLSLAKQKMLHAKSSSFLKNSLSLFCYRNAFTDKEKYEYQKNKLNGVTHKIQKPFSEKINKAQQNENQPKISNFYVHHTQIPEMIGGEKRDKAEPKLSGGIESPKRTPQSSPKLRKADEINDNDSLPDIITITDAEAALLDRLRRKGVYQKKKKPKANNKRQGEKSQQVASSSQQFSTGHNVGSPRNSQCRFTYYSPANNQKRISNCDNTSPTEKRKSQIVASDFKVQITVESNVDGHKLQQQQQPHARTSPKNYEKKEFNTNLELISLKKGPKTKGVKSPVADSEQMNRPHSSRLEDNHRKSCLPSDFASDRWSVSASSTTKKSVRFADSVGLQLENVFNIQQFEDELKQQQQRRREPHNSAKVPHDSDNKRQLTAVTPSQLNKRQDAQRKNMIDIHIIAVDDGQQHAQHNLMANARPTCRPVSKENSEYSQKNVNYNSKRLRVEKSSHAKQFDRLSSQSQGFVPMGVKTRINQNGKLESEV